MFAPNLDGLLLTLFNEAELRVWFGQLTLGADLPGATATLAQLCHEAAALLDRRGRVDAALVQSLATRAGTHLPQVVAFARARGLPEPTPPASPAAQTPDPLAPFKAQIRERADLLADALCAPGADRLSLVYVEVQLEPDEVVSREDRTRLGELRRVEDALAVPHRLWALTGEAGSGKSTLLHHLALVLLDQPDGLLPVPLRVPDLPRGDTVEQAVGRRYGRALAGSVAERVAEGRAVLLLDGLDEALDLDLACDAIRALCADAARCPVFLASRPEGYRRPGAGFLRLQLRPLEGTEQQRLLEKLGVAADEAERALETLHRGGRMRRIAESPLLLTLTGLLLREGKRLPERRVDLYQQAVELLLEGRHRLDGAPRLRDPDVALAALGRVALALHAEARDVLPDQTVRALLACDPATQPGASKYGGDARGLLDELSRVAGLFVPDRPSRPTGWLFPHRTFREYLAALALADDVAKHGGVRKAGLGSGLDRRLAEAKATPALWAEVFALLTGLLAGDEAEALVARLVESGEGHKPLLFRVLGSAEGLSGETVWRVLGLAARRWEWVNRAEVLRGLPELVGELGVAVKLLGRFACGAEHGADLFWAHFLLSEIAAGRIGEGTEEEARSEAGALADRVFREYRPEARVEVLANIAAKGWWKAIPAGRFRMGSMENNDPDRWGDGEAGRAVEIARGFELLAVPVTNGLYERFDPGHATDREDFRGRLPKKEQGEVPVYNVSWYEAVAFALWLGCRLPTEVEWEYAGRAGSGGRFWSGDKDKDLFAVDWVLENSGRHPHPVALPPSLRGQTHPYGLYDLHGNVWEWCLDPWESDYTRRRGGFTHNPDTVRFGSNPSAPRVIRGGSWSNSAQDARSAYRGSRHPADRSGNLGFRLVRLSFK